MSKATLKRKSTREEEKWVQKSAEIGEEYD